VKYFAKLDNNNEVIGFTHIGDDQAPTEQEGINFLNQSYNHSLWKEYTKNGSIRKNGAVIGYTYDEARDAFIPPQPYPSWTLHEESCTWKPPTPHPDLPPENAPFYNWDESTLSWVIVE